jgi:hypothetical protein
MEAPKFYHNGKLVHYISHLPVLSIIYDPEKTTWGKQDNVSDADTIRYYGQYIGCAYGVRSLQGVIDLGNDNNIRHDRYNSGCLLADYGGNVYFAGISSFYWFSCNGIMSNYCDKNYKLILQQMYTSTLLYLGTLEFGDVTQVIKQYIFQMLSYDIHYRRASIDWHRGQKN